MTGATLRVRGRALLRGRLEAPGDKSLSHRALLVAALARGDSTLAHLAPGDDVAATAKALRAMGVVIDGTTVRGRGRDAFVEADDVVDCGNSGTALRLLAGYTAALPFSTVLTGDASVRSRPMRRVVDPLREMGAGIVGRRDGDRAPLAVRGGRLRGVHHRGEVASAQVKSALMLAALGADGPVSIEQPAGGRDHSERMFRALGLDVEVAVSAGRELVTVRPGEPRPLGRYRVPGDPSSAAFLLAAAALLPGSDVTVTGVTVNPTRAGFVDVLRDMGAVVDVGAVAELAGEPVADIRVEGTDRLKGVRIAGDLVPRLIDEIPVLAVLMAIAEGDSVVADAAELTVKETDRVAMVAGGLRALGGDAEERPDGLRIAGGQRLRPGTVKSGGDHRIAMAFAVAGLALTGETTIEDAGCIATSYPGFAADLSALGADVR